MLPVVFLISALPGSGDRILAQPAPDVPRTVEQLDRETRQRYEALHREFRKAQAALEQARQQAYAADSLLAQAVEGLERARRLSEQAGRQRSEVEQYYEEQGEDALRQFQRWKRCRSDAIAWEWLRHQAADPERRPFALWFSNLMLRTFQQDPDRVPDEARALLPAPDEEFSDEQGLALYIQIQERLVVHDADECRELEAALAPPQFVRDYVEADALSRSTFLAYDTYVRTMTPESIDRARAERSRLIDELDAVWPNWRAVEQARREAEEAARQSML